MTVSFVRRVRGTLPVADIRRDLARARAMLRQRGMGLAELTVVAVSPTESRRITRCYLKRNRAANVLAFRYDGTGEIIVAPAVIRRAARADGEPYHRALRRLVIHGLLHLTDSHHQGSTRAAKRFQHLEQLLLKRLAIA